jgi:hypothetical protein
VASTIRTLAKYLLPARLLDDEAGGAFHWSLSALLDVFSERARNGMEQRFPSRAGPTALSWIGQDRLISRGRDETDASYAARLRAWRYPRGHRIRGSVFGLLEQIDAYFGGGLVLYGIDASGNIRHRAVDDTETYSYGNAWNFDSVAATEWARQWLVIDASGGGPLYPQLAWGDPLLWDGAWGTYTDAVGIQGSTGSDWQAIRNLVVGQHRWLPAGTRAEWLIVAFDLADLTPDGTWDAWGEYYYDGTTLRTYWQPTRPDSSRWVALRDALLDYAGEVTATSWASRMVTDVGSVTAPDTVTTTIIGDDTDFPTAIDLPGGNSVAGDPTVFDATIRLIDDGVSV